MCVSVSVPLCSSVCLYIVCLLLWAKLSEINTMIDDDINKSLSGDEIPERDVTYLLSVYLFTTELRMTRPFPEHSSK